MLQVARLAPKLLGESVDLVRDFLRTQQNEDSGFKDRTGKSDLYYTVFGVDSLLALQSDFSRTALQGFLQGFGNGEQLDFVHLCCLARCRAAIADRLFDVADKTKVASELLRQIERFRSLDGGYNPVADSAFGTAYGSFLALGAYQDWKSELPEPLRLVQSFKLLETDDGAWTNENILHNASRGTHAKIGSTNATAAALTVLRNLGMPINPAVGDWLLAQVHPQGGFRAAPQAPMPDLLSTATALHALDGLQRDVSEIKEACLDFVDSLWTNQGSFHGNWSDDTLDCEYTFYGLLALGHLSL